MDRFEFVSASASSMDAATGDSKPNCQKTCSAFDSGGSQAFACASRSREQLSRAFQRAPCFSGRDILFRSSSSSTVFCKFLCHRHFVEHRFKRLPHLRGGVNSGFVFWVNSLFQKSFPAPCESCVRTSINSRSRRLFVLGKSPPYVVAMTAGSTHFPCSRIRSLSRSTASASGMLNFTGCLPT